MLKFLYLSIVLNFLIFSYSLSAAEKKNDCTVVVQQLADSAIEVLNSKELQLWISDIKELLSPEVPDGQLDFRNSRRTLKITGIGSLDFSSRSKTKTKSRVVVQLGEEANPTNPMVKVDFNPAFAKITFDVTRNPKSSARMNNGLMNVLLLNRVIFF